MRGTSRAIAVVALLLLSGHAGSVLGSHGAPVTGVVIAFLGMTPVATESIRSACAVSGLVENVSDRTVTVRVRYRASDASGSSVAFAWARIPGVGPSERREFSSSPFTRDGAGTETYACSALCQVEMIEAVAEPVP